MTIYTQFSLFRGQIEGPHAKNVHKSFRLVHTDRYGCG